MKLTKDQRHTAYIILLYELEQNESSIKLEEETRFYFMLCHLIFKVFGITNAGFEDWGGGYFFEHSAHKSDSINIVLDFFPEINKYKYSFPAVFDNGIEFRKTVLKQCIEETYNF